MLLSVKDVTRNALLCAQSPISRWLQDIVARQLDANHSSQSPLQSLLEFCRKSTDLVRAFWLAAVCREAVEQASKQKEEQTYGKVRSSEAGMEIIFSSFFCQTNDN